MSRYWIPAESQHWPAAATPPATNSGAPPSSRTPPVAAGTPPKEHDLPPTSSSASTSTSVSTKLENYESLNHGPEEAANNAEAAAASKEVKAEDNGVHKQPPLQNYSDYYQQHYNPTASTSPHNDLSSAFINSNSNVRSNPLARPSGPGNASKSSNKNRPNAGTFSNCP